MAGKKKASTSWYLAGEPVYPISLSPADEAAFENNFSFSHDFRRRTEIPIFQVPASVVKNRESAARASVGFLCKHFASKYRQHEIVAATATAASLPVMIAERCADSLSFLLGAALWLLDYVEGHSLGREFFALLPETADDALFFEMPMLDDFEHTPGVILRLMTVLCDRKEKYRSSFRDILRLIDKETAASLRTAFKECFLDYFGRYMEVYTRVKPAPVPERTPAMPFDLSVLPGIDPRGLNIDPVSAVIDEEPHVAFLLMSSQLIGASEAELRTELRFRRSVDLLHGFSMNDPYAICAAYLLLEKEGDALASLNTLTCAVIACADQHLPWGAGEANAFPKTFERGHPNYELCHTYVESEVDSDEDDELPDTPIADGWRLSDAQLFYFATGYALPRDRVPSENLREWFIRQGLSEERAREFTFGAMLTAYQDSLREELYLNLPFDDVDIEDEEPEEDEDIPTTDTVTDADQAELVASLTRQVKDLRRALHESDRTAKQFQDQLLEYEQRSAKDREELSQLRDVLYRMRSGEAENEGPDESEIELPWQVTRRVLIIGGHETWLKAIRPMLPGARFFERESLPDLVALRGADVIWIQPNALAHKLFYRVVHAARKENIPVRYFGYASARKCAEQLVLDEIEESAAIET